MNQQNKITTICHPACIIDCLLRINFYLSCGNVLLYVGYYSIGYNENVVWDVIWIKNIQFLISKGRKSGAITAEL